MRIFAPVLMKRIYRFYYRPAGVVKLVDTPDLGSGASRCEGSSPFTRTTQKPLMSQGLFLLYILNIYWIFFTLLR